MLHSKNIVRTYQPGPTLGPWKFLSVRQRILIKFENVIFLFVEERNKISFQIHWPLLAQIWDLLRALEAGAFLTLKNVSSYFSEYLVLKFQNNFVLKYD